MSYVEALPTEPSGAVTVAIHKGDVPFIIMSPSHGRAGS